MGCFHWFCAGKLLISKKIKKKRNKICKSEKEWYIDKTVRDIAQLGLARLSGGQKVASSNLAIPTICSIYGILDTTFGPAEIPFFYFPAESCFKSPYRDAMVDAFGKIDEKSIFLLLYESYRIIRKLNPFFVSF